MSRTEVLNYIKINVCTYNNQVALILPIRLNHICLDMYLKDLKQ